MTWCYVWCSSSESFEYIWTCPNRLPAQQQLISASRQKLIQYFSVVYPNITFQHLILAQLFAHSTWWSLLYHPSQFTFIDFIKGLLPTKFVSLVQMFTHNAQLTAKICLTFLHEVFVTSQQLL